MYKCSTDCSLHLRVRPPTISSERAKYSAVIKHTISPDHESACARRAARSHSNLAPSAISTHDKQLSHQRAFIGVPGIERVFQTRSFRRLGTAPQRRGILTPQEAKRKVGKLAWTAWLHLMITLTHSCCAKCIFHHTDVMDEYVVRETRMKWHGAADA